MPSKLVLKARELKKFQRGSWVDGLCAKERASLEELRSEHRSGALPVALCSIYRLVIEEFPSVKISLNTFKDWMRNAK